MRPARLAAALTLLAAVAALLGFSHRHAPAAPLTLEGVLAALDRAAPELHAVSAHADVADYTALVNDTTRSSGMLYFKRGPQGPMYALDLTQPPDAAKELLYRDQTAYVNVPASKQVTEYPLGNQQAMVNQFLLLGMGASGDDLTRAFHVALDGSVPLDGEAAVELTLTPLHPEVSSKLTKIDLWYDPRTWIAAQQQVWQLGGDYHLVRYTEIKRNPRLNDKLFATKFSGETVTVAK